MLSQSSGQRWKQPVTQAAIHPTIHKPPFMCHSWTSFESRIWMWQMGVVRCKPITTPFWVRIAIALVLACVSTFVALWVTSGGSDPQNKGMLLAAIWVIPLAFAAKLDWPSGASIALAGVTYFLFWMGAVWWLMHSKTMDSG